MGCIAKGMTKLDATFLKNIATAGEALPVEITVDNRQCKRDVLNTKLELVGNSFVQSDGGKTKVIRNVVC